MSSITSVIKSIQDIMRKDAGIDGDAQRLGQLSWLLFLKIFDAQEEELEFEQDNYRLPIPERLLWRNWAADAEGITGDALLDFVNRRMVKYMSRYREYQKYSKGYVMEGLIKIPHIDNKHCKETQLNHIKYHIPEIISSLLSCHIVKRVHCIKCSNIE
jgi:type I restriction-modification system DNA methylase subunit